MQRNNKRKLFGDRDEAVSHISECSKLAQKGYKTWHGRVRKVIYWELWKRLKFDHIAK